jgi:hypothetical protein
MGNSNYEQVLSNNLTPREISSLSKHSGLPIGKVKLIVEKFNEICPFGALNKKEFVLLYSQFRPEPNHRIKQLCDHIFHAFDNDKNGAISLKEFVVRKFKSIKNMTFDCDKKTFNK